MFASLDIYQVAKHKKTLPEMINHKMYNVETWRSVPVYQSMEKSVQKDWVINVNVKLDQMKDNSIGQIEQYWKKRSIYIVPESVRELNKHAYKPQVVSFGPFHRGQPHLKPMEVHKERAFLIFLKRSNVPLQSYIDSLAHVVQDLKDSYDSLDTAWQQDTEAFLHLMILDGCFMLEILRMSASINGYNRYTWKGSSSGSGFLDDDEGTVADYAPNDPIFSNHGNLYIMPFIKRDMLMIENQLPMLLLQNLLAVQNDRTMHKEFLNYHILKFYTPNLFVRDMGDCLHVLDVYKQNLILGDCDGIVECSTVCKFSSRDEDEIMWSATELHDAGIRFKKSKSSSLKDIAFTRGGVLRIPRIIIDDTTESMFLNLIAFERSHVGAGNEVTSYIFLMGNIIDNTKDVSLLTLKGIIQNAIGGDKAVANLFNSLCKDITLDRNSNLEVVQKCVHNYCKKPWNKWRATLVHTYFRNPWAILSVLAAIFLFGLTIVQTIYTVLQL